MKTFRSDLSNQEFPISEKVSAKTIRHSVLELIQKDKPEFSHESAMASSEMNNYHEKAISDYLVKEVGDLSDLEKKVLASIKSNATLTDKVEGGEGTKSI